ncbi:phosphotransferase [Methylobacterium platani]|uniref:Hydroxylysine kinase n=1 Tax=Methylobacterium platani TaxID=427683 RepID=A0A179S276_9HYPH|nr:phosphotransferase [Methylobacterium platani]OAS19410.1 hypothetical protein A5481_24830 [Methylobacterium platani]
MSRPVPAGAAGDPSPPASAYQTPAPRADADRLAGIVEAAFGVAADHVEPLASERDLTARVVARDGSGFIFKLGNAADDPEVLAFENRALQHVRAVDPGLPVPVVVAAPCGRTEVAIALDGHNHVGRLQTFLPGFPAHRARRSAAQSRAFGQGLARLSRALRDFRHPAEARPIIWDMKRAGELEARTVHIDDPEKRRLARDAIRRFAEIAARGDRLRQQVVHNDFHFHNVLLDPEDHDAVSGIIDFGDIVRTPLVYDIAIALSFQMREGEEPLSCAIAFLAAYHAVDPLLPEEAALLVDLIDARNAMTVTISEWRSKLYPEKAPYLLRNNPTATFGLFHFARQDREACRRHFLSACGA